MKKQADIEEGRTSRSAVGCVMPRKELTRRCPPGSNRLEKTERNMNIDQKTLAGRLRQARESANVTQDEVAGTIGLPRTALVQIENGSRAVSSLELARLALLYRREINDFFASELPQQDSDPSVVLFRRLTDEFGDDPHTKQQVQRCFDICRDGIELEDLLDRPQRVGPPFYQLPAPKSVMDAVLQGQAVALQERSRLGLGDAPIPDMADLLNGIGVWASGVQMPDWMSGLFFADPRFGVAVLVNFEHPRARKRFSYAHEFAHALMDRDLQANVSKRDNSNDLREKRANAFAAAFLMPEGGVKSFFRDKNKGQPSRIDTPMFDVAADTWADASLRPVPGSQTIGYQDIAAIADHFRVSYQAAVYRLKSIGLLSAAETTALLEKEAEASLFMEFLGMFKADEAPDADKRDRELVAQVAQLAIEAYRREEISRGRLMEIARTLNKPGQQLLRFAEASRKD